MVNEVQKVCWLYAALEAKIPDKFLSTHWSRYGFINLSVAADILSHGGVKTSRIFKSRPQSRDGLQAVDRAKPRCLLDAVRFPHACTSPHPEQPQKTLIPNKLD